VRFTIQPRTLTTANNCAISFVHLGRYGEAKALLRKTIPAARRALGEDNRLTLKMRRFYARTIYEDKGATLADLREAVTTLAELERTAQRVLGGAHPTVGGIEDSLRKARAVLRARET